MTTLKQFAIELPAIRDEAKALWGEEWSGKIEEAVQGKPKYQYHLQQMLTSNDPVKYLKENSGKEK